MLQSGSHMHYFRPRTIDEALVVLGECRPKILAGGTDFWPALRDRPVRGPVLDITAIDAMRGISRNGRAWRIGALATWTDLRHADLPQAFDALKQAAREVGSVQIQNRATIAGNLCNASPAADGVPALLILDATVVMASATGERRMPLGEFVLGNRRTALAPDEIVTAIEVPESATSGASVFAKLGARKYLVISIASVAVRLACGADGSVDHAAVAVGACSEAPQRLTHLETELRGQVVEQLAERRFVVSPDHLAGLSPIDDVRAPAGYRIDAAAAMVSRALAAAAQAVRA
nr:FAD binding domain-containing protein [Rhizobiaceae bacterium]